LVLYFIFGNGSIENTQPSLATYSNWTSHSYIQSPKRCRPCWEWLFW